MSVQPTELSPDDEVALDSLHMMPLSIIPLQTAGLKRAMMRKNAKLQSVVELFRSGTTGSGQIMPRDLRSFFQDVDGKLTADIRVIEKLSTLESFDVYSLRIALRQLAIGFEDYESLQLSASKRAELTDYMRSFTRPLINRVYGQDNMEIRDVADIIAMLSKPNRQEALQKLQELAEQLGIEVLDVPEFLERYGDVFLSISYYRSCFDQINAEVPKFLRWMQEITKSHLLATDHAKRRLLEETDVSVREILAKVERRFGFFSLRSKDFWTSINANSFNRFRELITSHHVSIAAVLCALAVKFMHWKTEFPSGSGGLPKRLDFVMAELRPGLDHVLAVETAAQQTMESRLAGRD